MRWKLSKQKPGAGTHTGKTVKWLVSGGRNNRSRSFYGVAIIPTVQGTVR